MEREYFFKGLVKRLSKAGKGLVKRGLKMAKGLPAFQALSGLTQLARGNLKGMLANLAKTGLQAAAGAIPGGAIALPALQSLGIVPGETSDPDWARFTEVAERSYDHLARNLNEQTPNPIAAAQAGGALSRRSLSRPGSPRSAGERHRAAVRVAPGAGAGGRRTVRVCSAPREPVGPHAERFTAPAHPGDAILARAPCSGAGLGARHLALGRATCPERTQCTSAHPGHPADGIEPIARWARAALGTRRRWR